MGSGGGDAGQARGERGVNATRPTMRHVADMAGVSLKTVSRVMNSEPHVSAETV